MREEHRRAVAEAREQYEAEVGPPPRLVARPGPWRAGGRQGAGRLGVLVGGPALALPWPSRVELSRRMRRDPPSGRPRWC